MSKKLYFISIVPPGEIRTKIKSLKEEMRDQFNAKHALKAPAHITLQMPFRREEKFESQLIPELKSFAAEQIPFEINLNGFDCFEPRVIFVKITNHKPVQILYGNLRESLIDKLSFDPDKLKHEIHPHMTIATRDLKEDAFYKAWDEFKNRPFEDSFKTNSITLLKHNGKDWDIYKEFLFRCSD